MIMIDRDRDYTYLCIHFLKLYIEVTVRPKNPDQAAYKEVCFSWG